MKNGSEVDVMLLLDSGANVDAKDNAGGTILHCAARGGSEAVVKADFQEECRT